MNDTVFTCHVWWDESSPNVSKIRTNDDDPDNIKFTFDEKGNLKNVELINEELQYYNQET